MKKYLLVFLSVFSAIVVIVLIILFVLAWIFLVPKKNDNFNMKSVTNENLQFYFTAELRKGFEGEGKSSIFLCDVVSDTYSLKYSSEKYNIQNFCVDKEIIYFIGEYGEKYDLVKLENDTEINIAEFDIPIYYLKKIDNKLYYAVKEKSKDNNYIVKGYCYDLIENEIITIFEHKFEYLINIGNVEFISDSEIYLEGWSETTQYIAYLISGIEITEINNAQILQKYNDILYIYFWYREYQNIFGIYDIKTKEVIKLKKFNDNDFVLKKNLIINKNGKYAIIYASRKDLKNSFIDQMQKDYITIINMETYKQAAVRCIDLRENFYTVYSYAWIE